jgi:C-terminal processing protease CtpA/Prc
MKAFLHRALIPLIVALPFILPATDPRIENLDYIKNTFDVYYAPADWKRDHFGWSLNDTINASKQKVQNDPNMTLKEYQRVVRDLFNSTKDYHVQVHFFSTEFATLPLRVLGSQGKYFVVSIDREKLPLEQFPVQEGDELVQIDGQMTQSVAQMLIHEELGDNTSETDERLADLLLTRRSGKLAHVVPNGNTALTIKSKATGKSETYTLAWEYESEKINAPPTRRAIKLPKKEKAGSLMITPLYEGLRFGKETEADEEETKENESPYDLGTKISYLPELGQVIWSSDPKDTFHAYIYLTMSGKKIGMVRIPSYVPDDMMGALDTFSKLMNKFQKETDALVIDQINNPGGMVIYLYELAARLTDKPLTLPKHRLKLAQSELASALDTLEKGQKNIDKFKSFVVMIDEYLLPFENGTADAAYVDSCLNGLVLDREEAAKIRAEGPQAAYEFVYNLLKSMKAQFLLFLNIFESGMIDARFVIDEWNYGHLFTQPTYLMGIEKIDPNVNAQYTKPILVLINGLDFSGGDFFPALLQDNERATIFGTRTSGAGGCVSSHSYPNLYGISSLRYTNTIAERSNGNPIENLGITPDIHYELTENDIVNGYGDYKQAINEAMEELLK